MQESDFLKTKISYGVVLRADLGQIDKIKKFLSECGVTIVYQTVSGGHLWVVEKGDGGGRG